MSHDERWVRWPERTARRYRALSLWTGATLSDMLAESAARAPERLAFVDARRRLTYRAFEDRVASLARGLHRLAIRSGDAVVVQLPNCCELFEVLFALFRVGARPVMALPAHREREIGHFVAQTRAVAHVTCDERTGVDYRALSRRVREAQPSLRHTIVVGDAGPFVGLEDLYDDADGKSEAARVEASDVALFQLSGGSTNVPKLIPRTHDDYLYSVRQSVAVCGFNSETVYLAVLPAAHNFPLSSPGVFGTLLAGGTVVLSNSSAPDHTFPVIAREGVSVTALVPALVPAWLQHASERRGDVASLQLIQVGGAKLHETIARRIRPELGCALQQVFGMAEGLVCYTRLDEDPERVVATQGRPMSPFDELRVVDDDDREVPRGEVGHLLVRGPYTIRGYYDAAEYNERAFTADGYYRTGDRVRVLDDGSLVVEGRSKEQINRAGEKIAAPEVEELLCTHPAVVSAALVAVPDRFLGERACAFVILRERVPAAILRGHLRAAGLATYKIPDCIEVIEHMPLTAVGKVDKKALEQIARQAI